MTTYHITATHPTKPAMTFAVEADSHPAAMMHAKRRILEGHDDLAAWDITQRNDAADAAAAARCTFTTWSDDGRVVGTVFAPADQGGHIIGTMHEHHTPGTSFKVWHAHDIRDGFPTPHKAAAAITAAAGFDRTPRHEVG